MVAGSLPSWFQADNVFSHNGRWYFGCMDGLHVGPYAEEEVARCKSMSATMHLRRTRTDGEKLRYVRELLRDEWGDILNDSDAEGGEVIQMEHIDLTPPPMRVREGEPARTWFRSGRFFQVDSAWFIATREGIDVGPFASETEAREHEKKLIMLLTRCRRPEQAYRIIYEYKHRPAVHAA